MKLEKYYLWSGDNKPALPWARKYVNLEFLEYEKKIIRDRGRWIKKYNKTENNGDLEEISFYTVPIDLPNPWKTTMAENESFSYTGLSALYNTLLHPLIALFPHSITKPMEFRLIRITSSKKTYLFNKISNQSEPAIIIGDWDYLPSDRIYVDISYEEKIISKLFEENLINDKQLALSFQSPITSAPYMGESTGGISLSSLSRNSALSKELSEIFLRFVPPEYRRLGIPKKAKNGTKYNYFGGIKFHLAEKPYADKNNLSSFYTPRYDGLDRELSKRNRYVGEFSISTQIKYITDNIWEMLANFTDNDITISENISDYVEQGNYLKPINNVINEDLWVQIVHSRQLMPVFNANSNRAYDKTLGLLTNDFDVLLSDSFIDERERRIEVGALVQKSCFNVKRLSKSFTRADGKEEVKSKHLKEARNLIIDNFTMLYNHPGSKRAKLAMVHHKDSLKDSVVRRVIKESSGIFMEEIFAKVKSDNLFKGIEDLQKTIEQLEGRGDVYFTRDFGYKWVK